MRTVLKHTTEKGQLFSILDSGAQHTLGAEYTDKYGARYEYWKNVTGAACVPRNAHIRGWGDMIQAEANNPSAVLITEGTAQYGRLGLAQAAIPDDYFGWFLVYGPTTGSAGKLFFGNAENHTQTRTTTVGEPLLLTNGLFVDDTTTLPSTDGLQLHTCATIEAVTSAISCHVFITGDRVLTAT